MNELRRTGDVWHVAYGGTEVLLRHRKGLADLVVLLSAPMSRCTSSTWPACPGT